MIGAIADDFTGATDIAVAFRRAGLRVAVVFDGPQQVEFEDLDVLVVALKTRTVDPADAVGQSLDSLSWLRDRGAGQIFFKYCSTFDSRPQGNIGPVADALLEAIGASRAVFVPSSPEHGRTQYMGQLYVGRSLLSDSPMRHHPLTPMTNAYIPAVLTSQTRRAVTLVDTHDVRRGPGPLRERLDAVATVSPYVVVDAIDDGDLRVIGEAVIDDLLVTGAAGLAAGLGHAVSTRRRSQVARERQADPLGVVRTAVLAGSCSARTLEQVENMRTRQPSLLLDATTNPDPKSLADAALDWYDQQDDALAPLIYSSLPPERLTRTQEMLGVERASEVLETAMGLIARRLVARGVRRLIIAGGETSGAVVTALGVTGGVIGEEVAPGVPWIYSAGEEPMALLLKSGNFGDPDFLLRAIDIAS